MGIIAIYGRARCKDCIHCKEYHAIKKNGEPYKTAYHYCEIQPPEGNIVYLKNTACDNFKSKYSNE